MPSGFRAPGAAARLPIKASGSSMLTNSGTINVSGPGIRSTATFTSAFPLFRTPVGGSAAARHAIDILATAQQIGDQPRNSILMTLRPATFDRDVLPLEITTSFSLKTAKVLSPDRPPNHSC